MKSIEYSLTLASDGESGTGLGGKLLDQLLPRDANDQPVIRGSHLKGLMRENLLRTVAMLDWEEAGASAVSAVLGRGGEEHDAGVSSGAYFEDAVLVQEPGANSERTLRIFRTAIAETGRAATGTLRGSEAIDVGAVFSGKVHLRVTEAWAERLILLGLLSITRVGRGRQRGSGACWVEVLGKDVSGEAVLQSLADSLPKTPLAEKAASPSPATLSTGAATKAATATWYVVRFAAEGSVCCPEAPVRGVVNVIRSGPPHSRKRCDGGNPGRDIEKQPRTGY